MPQKSCSYKQKKPQTFPHCRTILSLKTNKKPTNAKPGFSLIFLFSSSSWFFFFKVPTSRSPKIFDYQKDSPDLHSKGMFADLFMIRGKIMHPLGETCSVRCICACLGHLTHHTSGHSASWGLYLKVHRVSFESDTAWWIGRVSNSLKLRLKRGRKSIRAGQGAV